MNSPIAGRPAAEITMKLDKFDLKILRTPIKPFRGVPLEQRLPEGP